MMRYQDIPEEIRDFVRDNHCNECRGGRARCEESNERECDSFFEEARRLMEEDNLPCAKCKRYVHHSPDSPRKILNGTGDPFHYDECELDLVPFSDKCEVDYA